MWLWVGRCIDRVLAQLPEAPPARLSTVAVVASVATLLLTGSLGYVVIRNADADRAQRLGKALAEELAVLAIEPLIAGDRVHLGVLANRIAELDAISNVTIQTIDDRVLAEVGRSSVGDVEFTEPILLEGDLAGYVRVTVAPGAFGTRSGDLGVLLLAGVLAAALCGAIAYSAGRRIERRRQQLLDAEAAAAANDEAIEAPCERFFLVVNLFNQLSLPSVDRHTVIAACAARMGVIARRYRGRCDVLPGTGLVLQFDASAPAPVAEEIPAGPPSPDRTFEAVCAALLAVDVVGELVASPPIAGTPKLDFRFALHVLSLPAEHHIEAEAINDTVLFSAVAPSREIAASQDLFARIVHKERFGTRTQENPALHALTTAIKGSCVLISGVDDDLRVELDRQVDALIGATPSTSSPSTF